MKRIPSTGDLLLVWNAVDRRQAPPEWRSPLTTAVSKDEGLTWQHVRDLEQDVHNTYCYPSATFTSNDRLIATYYVGGSLAGGHRNLLAMKVRALPIEWCYQ